MKIKCKICNNKTLEEFIDSRAKWHQIARSEVVQVATERVTTMLAAVALAQQYEVVVTGTTQPIAEVHRLEFADILQASFDAARSAEVSA